MAPIVESHTMTMKRKFINSWKKNFKEFLSLPRNMDNDVLEIMMINLGKEIIRRDKNVTI